MKQADAEALEASLEIAAEHNGDLTADVYARLFAAHPEMAAQFARDVDGAVKGEMLAKVFDMILDHTGAGTYASGMIRNEVGTHESYGVPPEVFPRFFEIVAATVRAAVGDRWSPQMEEAWSRLVADFRGIAEAAALG